MLLTIAFIHFSHGDLPADRVTRWGIRKRMLICDVCLQKAQQAQKPPLEEKTFVFLQNILDYLNSNEVDTSSDRNNDIVARIMHKFASLQSAAIDCEIQAEIRSSKSHQNLKVKRSEESFLSDSKRNIALLRTLQGFAKIEVETKYDTLPADKLYAFCSAYEAILSMKHSKVTTAPAVMRNFILYKTTHNRGLLESIGAPSGGKHSFLESLMRLSLPRLSAPNNDFVNCDDNLQVKRVVSSSKLKEGFKHTVKVVNSHVHFQNEKDQSNHILTNEFNKPKFWLKQPTVSDVEEFERKIELYQVDARSVRATLLKGWLADVSKDIESNIDPVEKLVRLRRSRPDNENIFPCPMCDGLGGVHIYARLMSILSLILVQDVCPECGYNGDNLGFGTNPYWICPPGM